MDKVNKAIFDNNAQCCDITNNLINKTMKKINVAELLRDCPKGMRFDCLLCNSPIALEGVDSDGHPYPIKAVGEDGFHHVFTEYGTSYNHDDAKCAIFPRGKNTWEGFIPPYKFKNGDIIFIRTNAYTWISIFKQFGENRCCTYVDLCISDNDLYIDSYCLCYIGDIITQRFATEEEKEKLFAAIKAKGCKWNPDNKTLEKLIEPKFKVRDRIAPKNCKTINRVINAVLNNRYNLFGGGKIAFSDQDNWELVTDKFDITTLVPFESRVLTRDNGYNLWQPGIWGFYDKEHMFPYVTIGNRYRQCIPFEGNEHLLGTSNDCDEHFKIWK